MDQRKERGRLGEQEAASFLLQRGVLIRERNFRCRFGEIDLIGEGEGYLLVIEVKTRRKQCAGYGAEAVDLKKQKKICLTLRYYLAKEKLSDHVPVRFDVIVVDRAGHCRWIKNAFGFQEGWT
ncbi:MAG: YraN family protein [Eubacterium sp.]|nr:YraN family protein [Eubacterium sp.]MDD7209873.1 YraN family protein [Lachnospiraceae bacterium]MDY5497935.1 YraN family protein [Anaerobutyricum sp.]